MLRPRSSLPSAFFVFAMFNVSYRSHHNAMLYHQALFGRFLLIFIHHLPSFCLGPGKAHCIITVSQIAFALHRLLHVMINGASCEVTYLLAWIPSDW